jgi:outer membrane protein TolC
MLMGDSAPRTLFGLLVRQLETSVTALPVRHGLQVAFVAILVTNGCSASRLPAPVASSNLAAGALMPPKTAAAAMAVPTSSRLPPVATSSSEVDVALSSANVGRADPREFVKLASATQPLSPLSSESPESRESIHELPRATNAHPQVPETVLGQPQLAPPDANVREVTLVNILASVAGRNPEVAFASQRYAEAYARLVAARVLWLPAINAGVGWNNHAGPVQASDGVVSNAARSSLTAGLGVQTIGAGSPVVPGLFANFHSADAIFQPRIANRAAAARDAAVRTRINDLLLETSLAYLELLRAHQSRAIAIDIRFHAEQLADATANFAKAGEGTQADADRAATELSIRQNEVVRADEEIQVASARVVELFNDSPYLVLQPLEPTIVPIELVPLDVKLDELVPRGLSSRPELVEAQHLVGEAMHRYRLEKTSPFLPNVLMGASYAAFGGGPGAEIDNTEGRFDLDAIAYWQVRGLGVGEYAARRETLARYNQTRFEQVRVMNQVAREIVQAHARVQARHRQIAISQQAVARAVDSFDRNLRRVKDLQGLPIETLQSIQALDQARREYLRAVVDYNSAQFNLQRALGWPVQVAESQVTPEQG